MRNNAIEITEMPENPPANSSTRQSKFGLVLVFPCTAESTCWMINNYISFHPQHFAAELEMHLE